MGDLRSSLPIDQRSGGAQFVCSLPVAPGPGTPVSRCPVAVIDHHGPRRRWRPGPPSCPSWHPPS